MTFQQLEYLLAVCRTRSVTKAAKELFVAPSSISISIGKLENELGYPLFTRDQKGLVPTPRGVKVAEYAKRICQAYKLLGQVEHDEKTTIRINGGGQQAVGISFAALLDENWDRTDVNFTMTSYTGQKLHNGLLSGDIDVSIHFTMSYGAGYWEAAYDRSEFVRTVLANVPAVVCVGPGHRLYDAERIYPYELKGELLVDDPHKPVSNSNLFQGVIPTSPDRILFVSNYTARIQLVAQGKAYFITPKPSKNADLAKGCRYIPLDSVSCYVASLTNPNRPMRPEVNRFLELLKEELGVE